MPPDNVILKVVHVSSNELNEISLSRSPGTEEEKGGGLKAKEDAGTWFPRKF